MNRRFPIYALVALVITAFASACDDNDDDDFVVDDSTENALMVNSFALQKNDSILNNLDSVFFSIDLDRGVIFNADSLPKGTRTNRLVIDMTLSAVSKAEITMPNDKGVDTVVNFLKNATDSINFSRGYVKLHLESANKEYQRDYTIYVNVHKVDPDLLTWNSLASTNLPTAFASADAQHTVEYQGNVLCFTRKGSDYNLATTDDPSDGNWTNETVTLPADADLNTLTAGATTLYICDTTGNLHSSADGGKSWTATGAQMSHIYGTIEDQAVGVATINGKYTHVTYPATTQTVVDPDCPVSATSPALVYTTEWSTEPMMIVAGGRTASNELTDATWAYDGSQWAKISINGFGTQLEAPVVVPYFAFKTATNWTVTKRSILLAFNGLTDNGHANRKLYISYDRGVHWAEASDDLQLPASFQGGAYSQALVLNIRMSVNTASAGRWTGVESASVAPWLRVVPAPLSRASTPITEWDCPFIYVFGGETATGSLNTTLWRGVINRLEFKPLQ